MDKCLLGDGSFVFQRADPYAVSGYVNEHIGCHDIRLPASGHPSASLNHRRLASLDLCRIRYGGAVRVVSPALATVYHLQVLLRGHCRWLGREGEQWISPGELLLINPDDPVDLTYTEDCEKLIVKLPVELIDRACQEGQWLRPAQGVRFESRHLLDQLEGLDGLLRLACLEAESKQLAPPLHDQYAKIIATKLLSALHTNITEMRAEPVAGFDHIIQFIEENLKQNIAIEQLAMLARTSPRTLYTLFERHTGMSPRNFIRRRKLERIRTDLSSPGSGVRNVTEIALEYGFVHLGRFSQNYKSAFGELPSDTLRRRSA